MGSILERDLVYVTGKGGVGRSTVCGALGLAGAALGRRTIVCEVAEQDRLSRAFRRPPRLGDNRPPLGASAVRSGGPDASRRLVHLPGAGQ